MRDSKKRIMSQFYPRIRMPEVLIGGNQQIWYGAHCVELAYGLLA